MLVNFTSFSYNIDKNSWHIKLTYYFCVLHWNQLCVYSKKPTNIDGLMFLIIKTGSVCNLQSNHKHPVSINVQYLKKNKYVVKRKPSCLHEKFWGFIKRTEGMNCQLLKLTYSDIFFIIAGFWKRICWQQIITNGYSFIEPVAFEKEVNKRCKSTLANCMDRKYLLPGGL